MKYFHIKSIILGIGIGIILTSIINMIYLAGAAPQMSRDEIISKAKQYGLVEPDSAVIAPKDQTATGETDNKSKEQENGNKQTSTQGTNNSAQQEVAITVNKGDTSDKVAIKLLEAGVISDKEAFKKDLVASGLETEINVGSFKIKKGLDSRSIIKVLTNK